VDLHIKGEITVNFFKCPECKRKISELKKEKVVKTITHVSLNAANEPVELESKCILDWDPCYECEYCEYSTYNINNFMLE
jgi:uncharacterized protein with PIN domain